MRVVILLVSLIAVPYIMWQVMRIKGNKNITALENVQTGKSVSIFERNDYALMDVEEYLVYCLPGIVDMGMDDEMLKTMAIIMRTSIYGEMYPELVYQSPYAEEGGETGLEVATGTDSAMYNLIRNGSCLVNEDSLTEVRYDKSELMDKWGGSYSTYMNRLCSAVLATKGQVICYEGMFIVPVYHQVSVGQTVSAQEIYGKEIPYLQGTDSKEDITCDGFSVTQVVDGLRIKKLCDLYCEQNPAAYIDYSKDTSGTNEDSSSADDETKADNGRETTAGDKTKEKGSADNVDKNTNKENEINILEATEHGFVKYVNVFGKTMTGQTFAGVMGLQSANFHIDQVDDGYRIITIGKGNSLGLSLWGGEAMARQGRTCDEIIKKYYANVDIVDMAQ